MSRQLVDLYLSLEGLAMDLDDSAPGLADTIRDALDRVSPYLTPSERAKIDAKEWPEDRP